MSGNGKMLDHDDDSLGNINILVDKFIFAERNIWGYFEQCSLHGGINTIQCQYLFCIISSL